jgi:hypothetical protein
MGRRPMAKQHSSTGKRVGFFGWLKRIFLLLLLGALGVGGWWYWEWQREVKVLKQMISRLTAEERVAHVLVDEYQRDEAGGMKKMVLRVVEIGPDGKELPPVFCSFTKNDVVHFEAMVIRLNDELIMEGKGKSVFFFRRAFALDDDGNTYEKCDINKPMEVANGYSLGSDDPEIRRLERLYWKSFWKFALDEERRKSANVKNAQIEAPATRFVPDLEYELRIEHDGGLVIGSKPVPERYKRIDRPGIETPDKKTEVGP